MKSDLENLIDSLYEKLKIINSRKLNLSKNELKEFVFQLIKSS